jgi:putative flippase GtrA
MQASTREYRGIQTPLDRLYTYLAQRFGGDKAKELERFLKFATVGIVGAVLDFVVLNVLLATFLPASQPVNVAIATTIAFVTAVSSNFFWNRFWTYPDSRSRSLRRQLTQFFVVSFVGWFARLVWVTVSYVAMGFFMVGLIHTLFPQFVADLDMTKRIGSNFSLLIAIVVVMIWNFFVNRYWTYSDVS